MTPVTRVKVCGITRPADAVLASSLGACAIGMVFWPGSPRVVDRARAREIVLAMPPFIASVGVFVNQPIDEVLATAEVVGLTAIQLHGDETAASYVALPRRVIKAVAVHGPSVESEVAAVPPSAVVLLDAHDPVRRGGTGRTIDWTFAASIARRRPVILSGGLTPQNVADAVRDVDPYAVDVSSGVESSPGQKDPAKLRALFAALQEL
jgi:phosphoribosylanthranilate isomerase